jgi:hypothetical protein
MGVHLTGRVLHRRVPHWAYTSQDVYLIGVCLMGVHLTRYASLGRAPH